MHGDDYIFSMRRVYALVLCTIRKNGFALIHLSSLTVSMDPTVFAYVKGLGYKCVSGP